MIHDFTETIPCLCRVFWYYGSFWKEGRYFLLFYAKVALRRLIGVWSLFCTGYLKKPISRPQTVFGTHASDVIACQLSRKWALPPLAQNEWFAQSTLFPLPLKRLTVLSLSGDVLHPVFRSDKKNYRHIISGIMCMMWSLCNPFCHREGFLVVMVSLGLKVMPWCGALHPQ